MYKSWWPTRNVWKESGQNVGHWSTGNEDWYQKHLANIFEGKAQSETAQSWKAKLKYDNAQTRRFEDIITAWSHKAVL